MIHLITIFNASTCLEHLVTNLVTAVIGPFMMHARLPTVWIWLMAVAFNTVSDHSGYHLPFLRSSEFHDYHHVAFTECFGVNGITDFLFKTDLKFKRSISFKRHWVLLNLKSSARELFTKKVK